MSIIEKAFKQDLIGMNKEHVNFYVVRDFIYDCNFLSMFDLKF